MIFHMFFSVLHLNPVFAVVYSESERRLQESNMKIFVRGIGIFFSLLGVWVLIEYEQSLSRTGLPRETQSHIAVVVLVSISYFSSCINHSRKFSRFL